MNQNGTTLIIGLGNEILSDDGIGIKLVHDLEKQFRKSSLDFKNASCGGLEIIEMMEGYKSVIMIDAIKTSNGIPGNIYHFTPGNFRQSMHVSNFHDISFITAMKFGRESGLKLPDQIDIIAIEIVEFMTFSDQLSSTLEKKYPELLKKVQKLMLNILLSAEIGMLSNEFALN
jgi:hydrogenase maturation protease